MARSTVKCKMGHTEQHPAKDRMRRNWMSKVSRMKDIITISHGLLGGAQYLNWCGRIQVCDIDPGVRETTAYLGGLDGGASDYPDLNILSPGCDIESTVIAYVKAYGVKQLGAVDVDLACTIGPAWEILFPVLCTLLGAMGTKDHVKVLLTFRNGRKDGFSSLND